MIRTILIIPLMFAVSETFPGLGESGSLGGLVLQFGAFGVVCWLAYYLVTKRMPEIEKRHQEERMAAEGRRQERDQRAETERQQEREMFAKTLERVMTDSRENRDAFLQSQCKYREQKS